MATGSVPSAASSTHSSQSSLAASRSGDEIDWRDRCQMLETSLLKFKQQASRIRELLAGKMQDMEVRAEEAESRALRAEERNKMLEQQLTARDWQQQQQQQQPRDADKTSQQLEDELRQKDKMVVSLQAQLDDQRRVRMQESQLLEEKSAKIKAWVTKKVKELETQNDRYRSENETLSQQVQVLRTRLQALPVSAAREVHRISITRRQSRTESELSDEFSPPIPKRPSSSVMECLRRDREFDDLQNDLEVGLAEDLQTADLSPDTDDNMVVTDCGIEPDYQEIDDNHESKYEPKMLRSGPPQVRIERKVFNPILHSSSVMSSTNGSEEMLDKRISTGSFTLPRRSRDVSNATFDTQSPVTLTPKSPPSPLTPFLPNGPPNTPVSTACLYAIPHSNNTVSVLATLPRRKKDGQKFFPGHSRDYSSVERRYMMARGGEVMGAPFERSYSERAPRRAKPPTPPMRRLPSWENRIYAIAQIGMRLPDNGNLANRESSFPVTDGLYMDQMFEDLTVPVYTTLRGKAAQIRSTPFTGDSSSDSSDNEEGGGKTTMASDDNEAVMSVAGPTGGKTTVTVTNSSSSGSGKLVRKPLNQTSSGATKRGVSSHSIASETSSDYAVPPDEEVSIQNDSSGDSEPEHKLLKYTADNFKKDCLEKTGYLTKLGGKVKSWKKRWFVLKNGELLYYKSPSDVARKPQGFINLDSHSRVAKTEGAHTFEIAASKKVYYLTAESAEDMEHWMRVLQNVLKKQAADQVLGQSRTREAMKGWIFKTKHGRSRRCWCVLMGKFFMYYKSPEDQTPLGQIHLRDARVEEVDRSCDSESDSDDTGIPDYTLSVWPARQGPTYLMIPTKHEKDSWLYHLTVASGGGAGNVGTEYEQLISKLMEVDGEPTCVFWKHPILLHSKEVLSKPLTTLPSEDLQHRAIELFKSCHSFVSLAIDSHQVDYHIVLAHSILDTCLQYSELQNELYCQLIKQTSRHPPQHKTGVQSFLLCGGSHSWFLCDASPTSPTNSVGDLTESKQNPVNYVLLQGWQLLSMAASLFLPRQSVLWYLKAHLQRNADPKSDVGKYAVFCQRALDRTLHNGGREARPSKMEIMSILLRNPYHHSQPFSIPVHFLNGTYQVVSFDGSTTVQEFLQSLNKAINMRESPRSGFALFTDDPAGQELEHCLKGHIKLCDVISKWEQAYLHHSSQSQLLSSATIPHLSHHASHHVSQYSTHQSRIEVSRTVKLTYKNRMYFRSLARSETEKEKLLLTCQVNEDIVAGRFPLNRDLAVELAALMAQIEYGDFRTPGESANPSPIRGVADRTTPPHSLQQIPLVIERFYPKRLRDLSAQDLRVLEHRIAEKWQALIGRSVQDCYRCYLTVARKWQFFGAKLFSARVKYAEPAVQQVWLAVQEDAVSVLEYASLKLVSLYDYKSVVTFGGCRDDFMLVVCQKNQTSPGNYESKTDRLLFMMKKPKILELTMLMASYINTRGQHRSPYRSSSPSASSAASLGRSHIPRYYHTIERVPRHQPSPSAQQSAMTSASMES